MSDDEEPRRLKKPPPIDEELMAEAVRRTAGPGPDDPPYWMGPSLTEQLEELGSIYREATLANMPPLPPVPLLPLDYPTKPRAPHLRLAALEEE